MFEILDTEIWIGLFALTAVLYFIRYLQRNNNKRTVYRVSNDSLQRSREVMMTVLPLVEEGDTKAIIDKRRLPYPKKNVKSAAKILAYYYWKKKQPDEFARVKNAYISLARFQEKDTELEEQARFMAREKKSNTHEFEFYMTQSPFNVKKVRKK